MAAQVLLLPVEQASRPAVLVSPERVLLPVALHWDPFSCRAVSEKEKWETMKIGGSKFVISGRLCVSERVPEFVKEFLRNQNACSIELQWPAWWGGDGSPTRRRVHGRTCVVANDLPVCS